MHPSLHQNWSFGEVKVPPSPSCESVTFLFPECSEQRCMPERRSSIFRGVRCSHCGKDRNWSLSQHGLPLVASSQPGETVWVQYDTNDKRKRSKSRGVRCYLELQTDDGFNEWLSYPGLIQRRLHWSWSQPMTQFYLSYGKQIQSGF